MNCCSFTGRITGAPKTGTYSGDGSKTWIIFSIANNTLFFNDEKKSWDAHTSFIDCVCFEDTDVAKELLEDLTKGRKIAVSGILKMRQRTVKGSAIIYNVPQLVVSNIDFQDNNEQWKSNRWIKR